MKIESIKKEEYEEVIIIPRGDWCERIFRRYPSGLWQEAIHEETLNVGSNLEEKLEKLYQEYKA